MSPLTQHQPQQQQHHSSPFQSLKLSVLHKAITLAEAAAGRDTIRRLAPSDANRTELCRYLQRLSDGSLAELIALMWLGRCPEGELVGDFRNLVIESRQHVADGPAYLAAKTRLADYLRQGLERVQGHC